LAESISDDGELKDEIKSRPYGPQSNLESQTASLLWYTEALTVGRHKEAREKHPARV
jgi:hypothetical protein